MQKPHLRIATRGSPLALRQATMVQAMLEQANPGCTVELVTIVSTGDVVRDRPLHELGGVGVFTKEVQAAVLDGRADLAVHSLKDLPTAGPAALCLAAVPPRAPAGDALIAPRARRLGDLPRGARVATSSLRRRAQLLRHRPDLVIEDIRGNVETRLRKLDEQGLDGLVLAVAGLERLQLTAAITQELSLEVLVPAVGQGALGIECRTEDAATRAALAPLEHRPTRSAVDAERAFLAQLQGGCQLPIGAHAAIERDWLRLQGIVLAPDGRQWFEGILEGAAAEAAALGQTLAAQLIGKGARELLERTAAI